MLRPYRTQAPGFRSHNSPTNKQPAFYRQYATTEAAVVKRRKRRSSAVVAQKLPLSFGFDWLKVPRNFWWRAQNVRSYRDFLAKQLGYSGLSDWYKLTNSSISQHGGEGLLKICKGSPQLVVAQFYPRHRWLPWRFVVTPRKWWDSRPNHRVFLSWLAQFLAFHRSQDFYRLTPAVIRLLGGAKLFSYYGKTMHALISGVFPSKSWLPFLFPVPNEYWLKKVNVREYFSWLFKKLKLQGLEDWYHVSGADFARYSGTTFLTKNYRGSLLNALRVSYPKHSWDQMKFAQSPTTFWSDIALSGDWRGLEIYVEQLADDLGITSLDQWHTRGVQEIGPVNAAILNAFGGLAHVLSCVYPTYPWDIDQLVAFERISHRMAAKAHLSTLFPAKQIIENYTNEEWASKWTRGPVSFDLFIPDLKLAFDYVSAAQYFAQQTPATVEYRRILQQDIDKQGLCASLGVQLVEVGFHWDRRLPSLAALIRKKSPDLRMANINGVDFSNPLPETPSREHYFVQYPQIPLWNKSSDTSMIIMEYYDGVPVRWDGTKLKLPSGLPLTIPRDDRLILPFTLSIDGMLWAGYETSFEELCAAIEAAVRIARISTQKDTTHTTEVKEITSRYEQVWNRLQFVALDVTNYPDTSASNRLEMLDILKEDDRVARWFIVPKRKYLFGKFQTHLGEYQRKIVAKGGAGVLLRKPLKPYGARGSVWAEKPLVNSEVQVVSVFRDSVGLVCKQPDGNFCLVQAPKSTLQSPPARGTAIQISRTPVDVGPYADAILIPSKREVRHFSPTVAFPTSPPEAALPFPLLQIQ